MKKGIIIVFLSFVILLVSAVFLLKTDNYLNFPGSSFSKTDNLSKIKDTKDAINDAEHAFSNDSVFSTVQKKAMTDFAYESLASFFTKENVDFPKALEDVNFNYDRVFVTFFNNGKIRCCQSGRAKPDFPNRIPEDLKQAVEKCVNDSRFEGKIQESEIKDLDITVDFLYNQVLLDGHSVSDLEKQVAMGLNAIKVEQGGKSAYFKASVPIEKNYGFSTMISKLCVKAKLADSCYQEKNTKVYKYDSANFYANRAGKIADLYRNNILININNIDENRIIQSINLGYHWLNNDVNPKTKMLEYLYLPSSDKYDDSTNHIRILAVNWATAEMMKFLNDDSMKETVHATLDDYLKKYKQQNKNGSYLNIKGSAKIAFNAFLAMALINTRDYPKRDELINDLGRAILAQQQSDGRFLTDFEAGGEDGIDYYAGESLLALMKLYYETGDEKYFSAAKKAFPYYRDYWRKNKNTAFIPWQTQTYYLMYQKEKNKEWANFTFEINDWLVDNYQQMENNYPDFLGGFKKIPTNSTFAYAEGVNDAYALAKIANDKKHEEKFLNSARLATRFVIQAQFTQENIFYFENKEKVLGGFRTSLLDNSIRCDNAQHAVLALIKSLNYGVFD